ncbi:MAG: SbcC/MukB-like Walker B domain-containing protein, partial [Ilumatobacter sp.]
RHHLEMAERSHADLLGAAQRELAAVDAHDRAVATHHRLNDEHRAVQTRLDTIEDSVGAEVAEVLAALATSERDLDDREARARDLTGRRDESAAAAAAEKAKAEQATHLRNVAETACERERAELAEVVSIRGLVDAVGTGQPDDARDGDGPGVVTGLTGADGLSDLVEQVAARLPGDMPPPVDAESVRMSHRQRQDTIGAGWDAEIRQPVATRPLFFEVHGPTGRGTLADQHRVIEARFVETSNLLTRKQDDALRGLLQGLIAQELATKVDEARRLIGLMNARLSEVRTAHDVGVELRWRRSPDLDEPTARLVELLSTVPDLRRPDDDEELRRLLAQRLDEARREHPDQPYRQLIGVTLDYRQWHELTVLLHRGGDRPARLRRSTPLSEGEKKLVTYLPMFAAVAASYDTLEMQSGDGPGPARFLLLDDAFAKVSEDNHAKLFGLVVDLDLDLIATSERLWGTHRTVPEIAITEVIRDAAQGVILLEHYRWNGAVLERVGDG